MLTLILVSLGITAFGGFVVLLRRRRRAEGARWHRLDSIGLDVDIGPAVRWPLGRQWAGFAAVGGMVGFVLIAYVVLKLAPDWFAETDRLEPNDRAAARQGVRTAALALLAGTIAVIGALYTARTFALNRAGQITDRFSKAVEQLGHKSIDVRLGGIYALERIARDSKDDHPQVVEVLTAYVREHAPLVPRAAGDTDAEAGTSATRATSAADIRKRPETDVQAVLTVIGRRIIEHEKTTKPEIDFARTQLVGANLYAGALSSANLLETNLNGANLIEASLLGARFTQTDLRGADLRAADLSDASFTQADLRGADLRGANLRGADLREADLREANLYNAIHDEFTNWPGDFEFPPADEGPRFPDGYDV